MKKVKEKNKTVAAGDNAIKIYAERIAELKRMNADLTIVLEEYRKKERKITEALSYAEEKKAAVEKEIKVKYALECERLAAFRKKWVDAVRNGTLDRDYKRTERVLDECRAQLLAEFDEETADYYEETERLDEVNEKRRHIDELSENELEELLKQI